MSTQAEATEAKKPKAFVVKIVYGTNKKLEVTEDETIAEVKVAALDLFGIDPSEGGNYHLQAKVQGDQDVSLEEDKTVDYYDIKKEQKVVLAAGAPFGNGS
jgi:hypothetical protein